MKAIFFFFFYGMMFFVIDKFFPEFFQTMVGWADHLYNYGAQLYAHAVDSMRNMPPVAPPK